MTLDEVRVQIDAVDTQIKPLFLSRMECARHVAEAKAVTGGDVYAPDREKSIIEKRAGDVEEFYDEYTAFLLQLMSISRRFQYGLLTDMQDTVINGALEKAGISAKQEHRQVEIAFQCSKTDSNLNMVINMAKLNAVTIDSLELHSNDSVQIVQMVLDGNLGQANFRQLLCQIGKEVNNFKILSIR